MKSMATQPHEKCEAVMKTNESRKSLEGSGSGGVHSTLLDTSLHNLVRICLTAGHGFEPAMRLISVKPSEQLISRAKRGMMMKEDMESSS